MSETARTIADDILKAAGSALRHYEAASQERIISVAQRWLDDERRKIADSIFQLDAFMTATSDFTGDYVRIAFKSTNDMHEFHRAMVFLSSLKSTVHPALTQGEEA